MVGPLLVSDLLFLEATDSDLILKVSPIQDALKVATNVKQILVLPLQRTKSSL